MLLDDLDIGSRESRIRQFVGSTRGIVVKFK
jgi:hypothetical protein